MQILTVTEIAVYLREVLDSDPIVRDVWIEGEVSNLNRHTSGHYYFTLKDGDAQLSAACWRSQVAKIGRMPGNGDAVLAHGRVAYYEARGQVQLYVDDIRPAGVGILQAQYERLKAQLESEGLFELSRKRPLPTMPRRIGLVTSPTGAALQDLLHVLGRRYPLAEVLVSGCRVQGTGAAESVVEALYRLYERDVDVIIVARGGGSIEDLWAFNEEIVARAAFASPVPLVSGVGHETDTTIIDYVADLRAPTPSAAAELVSPDRVELLETIVALRERLESTMQSWFSTAQASLEQHQYRLAQRSPLGQIARDRQVIDERLQRIQLRTTHRIAIERARLAGLRAQLEALSPQAIVQRGYAIVRGPDGNVVVEPQQVQSGDLLQIHMRGGNLAARVERL